MGKVVKAVVKGVKKIGSMAEDIFDSDIGRALTYAALGAAAVYTGGAALGAAGITSAGAAAGGGLAGAAAGGSAALGAGAVAGGITGAALGYQSASAESAALEQKGIRQAQQEADREADILRKQALLTSEKSLSSRMSTAAAVSNRLKNTSTKLGDDEEKLGD